VTVIGVPYHLDEYLPDLDLTPEPAELITAELPVGQIWPRLAVLYTAVAHAVVRNRADGDRPVIVAYGDCLTALGTVAGLQADGADPAIVWFDAHGDVQTPETTSSGYLAGMSLCLLTDYRPELIASRLGLRPVPEDRIVLVGARDLDPPEVTYLNQAPIRRRQVADLAVADLPDGSLYVHVDLDVVDAAQLPGLRYPTPAGPDARQVTDALGMLLGTGRVAAVGIACTWFPGHAAARLVAPHLEIALAAGLAGLVAGHPVDARVPELEAQPLVQPVGCFPRRPRGQVDGPGARGAGQPDRLPAQRRADPLAAGGLIDHHVLDPGPEPGGDRERHQRQHADDPARRAGHQEAVAVPGRDPPHRGGVERRR
jgi:arginase